MRLDEIRAIVAASIAGVQVATASDPFLQSLPGNIAQGAADRTAGIFSHALGLAEGVANRGATDIDFNGLLARLLTQHVGLAATVIFDHGETIGSLIKTVVGLHDRLERAEAQVGALQHTVEQTLAELVLVRRDMLGKGLDA